MESTVQFSPNCDRRAHIEMRPQEEFEQCLEDIRRIHRNMYLKFLGCPGRLAQIIAMATFLPLIVSEIHTALTVKSKTLFCMAPLGSCALVSIIVPKIVASHLYARGMNLS